MALTYASKKNSNSFLPATLWRMVTADLHLSTQHTYSQAFRTGQEQRVRKMPKTCLRSDVYILRTHKTPVSRSGQRMGESCECQNQTSDHHRQDTDFVFDADIYASRHNSTT